MAEVLNSVLEVNSFKVQSFYYVHVYTHTLVKRMNQFILPATE